MQVRVRVVTRHACGVRGVAVGSLRSFDKFFNMVLADVEEIYTVMVKEHREKARAHPNHTQHQSTRSTGLKVP